MTDEELDALVEKETGLGRPEHVDTDYDVSWRALRSVARKAYAAGEENVSDEAIADIRAALAREIKSDANEHGWAFVYEKLREIAEGEA